MKRALAIALVLGLVLTTGAPVASACGDKFLVPGQGPQLGQAYSSGQPGHILIFRNKGTEVAALMNEELEETLERVGHQVDIVENPKDLRAALSTGKYDVLLADVSDIEALSEKEAPPVALPVVYKASWMEVTELKESYECVLNAPSRVSQVLAVIEEAVNLSHVAAAGPATPSSAG